VFSVAAQEVGGDALTIIILPINVTWRTALLRKAMRIGRVFFNLRRILIEQPIKG